MTDRANVGSAVPARRYFTVSEANAMIGRLEIAFGRMLQLRVQIRDAFQRLEQAGFAPAVDDFPLAPPDAPAEVCSDLATLRTLIDALTHDVAQLHAAGCLVKDLESGLVDWYARHDERDVFLCWKLGEKEVTSWHDVDAGFAGRRPVSELG